MTPKKFIKKSEERKYFVEFLLKCGYSYREIQEFLKQRYGAGMSNTTIQSIQERIHSNTELYKTLKKCRSELKLYKKLYFEVKEMMDHLTDRIS